MKKTIRGAVIVVVGIVVMLITIFTIYLIEELIRQSACRC